MPKKWTLDRSSLAPVLYALIALWGMSATGGLDDPQAPEVDGPGWIRRTPAQVTPAEARARWLAPADFPMPLDDSPSPADVTPEIVALARALQHDPKRIFDYVRNRIDYEPTFGSVLGATATYYAGRGNDCDQASLLIALLRQSGFEARYVSGDVLYSPERLGQWLDAAPDVAQNVLLNGGVPIAGGVGGWWVSRFWAEVHIDGAWEPLDPAMKVYAPIAPAVGALRATLEYVPSTFLTRAQSGATVTVDATRNLNEANITNDLALFTLNLVDHLRENLPAASFDDVIGGRRIVETQTTDWPAGLPYALDVDAVEWWEVLPEVLHHTMTLTHDQAPVETRTFRSFEVAGRRMTLAHNGENTVLALDGTPVFTFSNTPVNASFGVHVLIEHVNVNAQAHVFPLRSGPTYAIVNDFDGVSPALMAVRNARLAKARSEGLAPTSEPVMGESLWLLGQAWCHQVRLFDRLVDRLNHTRAIAHHRVGVLGQLNGYYIDMPLMSGSTVSTDGLSDVWLSARVQSMMSSAFEHGVMRQYQNPEAFDSVSTIRMLAHANAEGVRTFKANASNWTQGANVRSSLVNYSSNNLNFFDVLIANGYDLVLPEDGQLQVEDWRGTGYVQHYHQGDAFGIGMIISGGLLGGSTAQAALLDSSQAEWADADTPPQNPEAPESNDPVDMRSGAFVFNHADLRVGAGPEPMALRWRRFYSSAGNNNTPGAMGRGWTHGYLQRAVTHSGGAAGLGPGGALNAAAAIAFAHVALDVLDNNLNALGWSTTALASQWAMAQLIGNAITVHAGGRTATFLRLPDGHYAAPPGSGDTLTRTGAGYSLRDAFGSIRAFDAAGRITELRSAGDNAKTLAYDVSDRLSTVTDAFGRTLSFAYDGEGRLTSVSDGVRQVGYFYADGNLTAFRDAAGVDWGYVYDAENRLTEMRKADPDDVPLVVNVYDDFGRVVSQTDALDNFYEFFLPGDLNLEAFPDGSAVGFAFGEAGAQTARQDPLGHVVQYERNPIGQAVRVIDRRGESTLLEYHPVTGQMVAMTNADGHRTTWTYAAGPHDPDRLDLVRIDYPGGAFEVMTYDAQGNLVSHTGADGETSTYAYNLLGQPLSKVRPDGGTRSFVYTPDGDLAGETDSDTGDVTYAYDALGRRVGIQYPDGGTEGWGRDARDRVVAHTNRAGGVTLYHYDANDLLEGITDPAGYHVAFAFDGMGRVTHKTDATGVLEEIEYDALGRVTRLTDPAGAYELDRDARGWVTRMQRGARVWRWMHDPEGGVTNTVSPLGHRFAIARDARGNPMQVKDPLDQTWRFEYDGMGRLTRFLDPLEAETRYGHDTAGRLAAITNALGDVATRAYNPDGNLAQTVNFAGHATTFGYTPMGRLASVTDALDQTTLSSYDVSGRLVRTDHPDGSHEQVDYHVNGLPGAVTDPDGHAWIFAYDARDALIEVTNPIGGVLSLDYYADGALRASFDSDTGVVSNRYDAAGRRVETHLPDGARIQYAFNEHDELVTLTDAMGEQTAYDYDADGRLIALTDAAGHVTRFAYDAADRLTNLVDRAGGVRRFEYDAAGRLSAAVEATGVRTQFTRDPLGRTTAHTVGGATWHTSYNPVGVVTNTLTPSGRATRFVPDAVQQLAQAVNPAGESVTFEHDTRGRVTAVTDPAGRVTRHAYNARGLLSGVTLPGDDAVAYDWNALGLLSRVTDFNASAWAFAYTPMGRLMEQVDPLGRVTQLAYDVRGQLSGITFPGGTGVDYTRNLNGEIVRAQFTGGPDLPFQRDPLGRLVQADGVTLTRDAEGRITATEHAGKIFGATYDAAGRLATATYDNGTFAVVYTYAVGPGGDGRLTRVGDTLTGVQIDFGYDADRRLSTLALPNGETIAYTLDDANRLVQLESGHHVDLQLEYDLSGRVTRIDLTAPLNPTNGIVPSVHAFDYDAASQIAAPGFAHDARGRVTQTPDWSFDWDAASRLLGATPSGGGLPSASYTYDGLDQQRTRTAGGVTLRFHHNRAMGAPGMTPMVAEQHDGTGAMLRYYVWTPDGRLLYMIDAADGNKVYFYHFDQNGNTLALTDMNGDWTDAWAYDPHGRVLGRGGVNPQPFTFVGAWGVRRDCEGTGLYQMRARWYDAHLGRFLSPEPIWPRLFDPKSLNPYQYAGADPIRFTDPSGLIDDIDFNKIVEGSTRLNTMAAMLLVQAFEEGGAIGLAQALQERGMWQPEGGARWEMNVFQGRELNNDELFLFHLRAVEAFLRKQAHDRAAARRRDIRHRERMERERQEAEERRRQEEREAAIPRHMRTFGLEDRPPPPLPPKAPLNPEDIKKLAEWEAHVEAHLRRSAATPEYVPPQFDNVKNRDERWQIIKRDRAERFWRDWEQILKDRQGLLNAERERRDEMAHVAQGVKDGTADPSDLHRAFQDAADAARQVTDINARINTLRNFAEGQGIDVF